ncbi:hypothetical protein pEaSNUABM40_00149 [Erwinia phage pEa_SNUABM_40]|uniref:Glycosyltransferase 2-like domain-containing protein n=1 Tax=Erwinia phage pEa_SNUABM_3 TaxID=2869552 RepID=A0AAE7XJ72_9CAUD|nr:beta-1,4-glycosyltransferase [Erwinia phage pEa_SNUABM_3]QZE56684.1 hypothetical protein pEaSNUABM20_00148 [Erwinia phage pEa_SNUABM_20]QZE58365.1 hypothetical protein pEaSNUABM40_00149 [Erwinia phage pEa_SNUABM_40]UAW52929.1 hypothetical protein pEaSNUABM23_00147 [Erwinia phage pEa_SNUABM_23]UIW10825.1 hypothetical protein pEaSNUABM23_00147 [Erwinia phage pEa_SNUABM_31]QZE56345.1 hypothetical protein pEaSNUABM3_00148 [Erwinia phage pEa_SNUABM_3]
MRICVAAICRNEEKNIGEWLKHVAAADAISIVDTGSTDNTTNIIAAFQHPNIYHSFDVSDERNLGASRELAATPFTEDDLVVWLDIDERFDDPNWVETLRNTKHIKHAEAVWILMRNGDSHYQQMKAYRRRSYFWKYRAHEVLSSRKPDQRLRTVEATFATDHYPDTEKERNYLLELGLDVGSYPHDDRCSFYYARELCYAVNYGNHFDMLDMARAEVARLAGIAKWSDYVAIANLELAKAEFKSGYTQESIFACYRAIAARPDRVECYAMLADIFYRRDDMMNAVGFAIQGIDAVKQNPKSFLFDQTSINLDMCYDLAYWGCRNLGMVQPALNYLAQLTTHRGEDLNEAIQNSGLLAYLQPTTQEQSNDSEATNEIDVGGSSSGEETPARSGEQLRADNYEVERVSDTSEQSQPD